jgi:hypothetical protein
MEAPVRESIPVIFSRLSSSPQIDREELWSL